MIDLHQLAAELVKEAGIEFESARENSGVPATWAYRMASGSVLLALSKALSASIVKEPK